MSKESESTEEKVEEKPKQVIPDRRVSITYTVDLSEVPGRVKLLMEELANALGGLGRLARQAGEQATKDAIAGAQELVDLKELIDKSSIRVTECAQMLVGYSQLVTAAGELMEKLKQEEEQQETQQEAQQEEKKTKKKKKKTKKTKKKKEEE